MAEIIRLGHDEIEEWRKRESEDAHLLEEFRRYAAGDQNQTLSVEQKRIMGGKAAHIISDNILRLVISTAASRLELEKWLVDTAQEVQDFLDRLFLTSRISRLQYDTHFAALRDGNTAVSLRWKPGDQSPAAGRVTVHRETWWNGKQGVFVAFDDYDDPIWAVRDFLGFEGGKEIQRRTIYYPDAIYRYQRVGGGWHPYLLPDDPEPIAGNVGYVPWLKRDGSPLGLPIVSFSNSLGDDGLYGRSDIYGLLGIQDDLNSIQHDIAAAAAFTGYQMYWASGVADGSAHKVGPGRLLTSENPASRYGVIPAGDMSALTDSHQYKRQTVAIDSSTPVHLITGGDWPSGEALLRAEMPLVDKVTRLARVIGPSWVLLAHRATEVANTFGGLALNEEAPIVAQFAPPERLDDLTEIQIQQDRVNLYASLSGISDPEIMAKTGLLTEAEINAVMDGREERAAAFTQVESEF
jgi:hypothetical protein